MIDPVALAIVLGVSAGLAGITVRIGWRWLGQAAVELAMGLGLVGGFIVGRSVQSLAAAGGGPTTWMDIVAAIGEQARALGAPRSASSWPPLIVLGVGLLALVSACVRRRWTRGVIWLLQSAALLGLIWLQFRTTRHMAAPSPESHAKLLNAGTLLLVGWLVFTGPAASRRAGQLPPGWTLAQLGLCGVALAVLLSLSGSLSLALESLVIPATACGLALGSLGLMGTQPSVADGKRPMAPHAIWCAVSLSYVLLGNLLATVTLRSAWLWVLAACAVSLGSVGLGSAKAWWLRIAFVLATICLLLGAVIPAYIQFARDTAF